MIFVVNKTSVFVQANKKQLTIINTLAYYVGEFIMVVKSFVIQALGFAFTTLL